MGLRSEYACMIFRIFVIHDFVNKDPTAWPDGASLYTPTSRLTPDSIPTLKALRGEYSSWFLFLKIKDWPDVAKMPIPVSHQPRGIVPGHLMTYLPLMAWMGGCAVRILINFVILLGDHLFLVVKILFYWGDQNWSFMSHYSKVFHLEEWKRISHKQSARWQHQYRLKASAFFPL